MPLWRRGTTGETTAVPGPRAETALPPDAGRDDSQIDPTQQTTQQVAPETAVPAREPAPESAEPAGATGPAGTPGAPATAGVPETTGVPRTAGVPQTTGVPGTAEPAAAATRPDTPPVHTDEPVQPGPVTRPAQDQATRGQETQEQETRERPAFEKPQDHKLKHTRLSGTWVAIVASAIILVLLLIFILQNSNTIEVSYLGAHGHLGLGLALLFAAVAGILLTALAGSARIMQLRGTARKHRRAEVKAAKAEAKAARH